MRLIFDDVHKARSYMEECPGCRFVLEGSGIGSGFVSEDDKPENQLTFVRFNDAGSLVLKRYRARNTMYLPVSRFNQQIMITKR